MKAAKEGDLATLTRLAEEGVNLNATDSVSAAPPAAPSPLRRPRRPPPSPPVAPAVHALPSPPQLTACMCGAAASPLQDGHMALMHAAINGKLDCLEHLIAKGANLEATNEVSAALPAALCPLNTLDHHPRPRRPPSLLPRALTAAADRVWPPCLCRTATRPSCMRLPKASSTASSTSSPRAPT